MPGANRMDITYAYALKSENHLPLDQLIVLVLNLLPSPPDTGVLAVCKLRHLEEISLQSCVRLTNKCFESLQHMTDLQSLNLRGCLQITSEGLLMISRLTKLENLDLTCCPAIQSESYPF